MQVSRVRDGNGSHIEPPYDQSWPPMTRLLWDAAVATLDSGLPLQVQESEFYEDDVRLHGYYDVMTPFTSSGPYCERDARLVLQGMARGYELALQEGPPP